MFALVLIDPGGNIWPSNAGTIQSQFDTNVPPAVVARFVVRNMGWIAIRYRLDEAVIQCRPGRIAEESIAAAAYFLADNDIHGAMVQPLHGEAGAERASGVANIMALLQRYLYDPPLQPPHARYLQNPTAVSPYVPTLDALRREGVLSLPVDEVISICDRVFQGRFTLASAKEPELPVRIVGIGTRYTHFRSAFYDRAVGLGFEDSPDVSYGRWIAQTMADRLDKFKTQYGEVDAEIRPYGKGPIRIRYDRMIVPFHGSDGNRYVLSSSEMRDGIDLRRAAVKL